MQQNRGLVSQAMAQNLPKGNYQETGRPSQILTYKHKGTSPPHPHSNQSR